ncbi:hypothetical protein CR513_08326, partial [Mucuna pruriens]
MIGPIESKASNGHRFILVAIDYFTKWVEATSYTSVTKSIVVKSSQARNHHEETQPIPSRPGPIPSNSPNSSPAPAWKPRIKGSLNSFPTHFHCIHYPALAFLHHGGARWCTVLHWCFSRLRKYRLETEKLKSSRGDRLGFQHTLVEMILSVQATGGEPPPSTMAIVVEDGSI